MTTRFERANLYDEVWSTPLQRLAKHYGISGVALGKICRKLKVPLPGRGYWNRVAAGQTPKKAPLPPLKTGQEETHVISRWRDPVDDAELGEEAAALLERERDSEMFVRVPESLDALHPLVKRYAGTLRRWPKKRGDILLERKCLDVKASSEVLERALRVMNAILKGLDARGFKIEVTDPSQVPKRSQYDNPFPKPSQTGVHIMGHFVTFCVEELYDIVKIEPEPPKPSRRGEPTWTYVPPPEHEHILNGKLSLKITNRNQIRARTAWNDGAKQRVEGCINAFLIGLVETAERKRVKAIADELRERARRLEWERQKEAQRRREIEEALALDLNSRIADWLRADDIRRFVDAVEASAKSRAELIDAESDLGRWLAWARNRADRLERTAVETVTKEQRQPKQ